MCICIYVNLSGKPDMYMFMCMFIDEMCIYMYKYV